VKKCMALLTLVFSVSLITNTTAQAKPKNLMSNRIESQQLKAKEIICKVFNRYCKEALAVSWCESRWYVWAKNGQYLGIFQMGSYERQLFGHGSGAWAQARAAYKYFVQSGKDWSPWSCRWAA
jgi:hypothetical protein